MNKCIKEEDLNATIRKKFFPGAKASELSHYILPALNEFSPDSIILHVGTNDLQSRNFEASSLANEVINIGTIAQAKGVNTVFISSITTRKDKSFLQNRIDEVNNILQNQCEENGFIYISNHSVLHEHVCNDGIHLLESGMCILANNFISHLTNFL